MKVTLTSSIREPKKTEADKELEAAQKKVEEVKQAQEAKKAEEAKQTRDVKQAEEKQQTEYVEGVAGETVEVEDEMGRDLIERGLATQAAEGKSEEKPPE